MSTLHNTMNRRFLTVLTATCLTAGVTNAQGDECTTATPAVVGGGGNAFDTSMATPSMEAWTCAGTHTGGDVWYTYTAGPAFGWRISLCGSTYDTALQLFSGACGALTEIACNDDVCALQSQLDPVLVAGTTYYIRVGGFAAAQGAGTLSITEFTADECSGARAIGAGSLAYDTTFGTPSAEPWSCAGSTHTGGDFWFSYTPSATGNVSINTFGSTYDTALMLYSGACGALTELACNDDTGGGLTSLITYCLAANTTYIIRVGGFAASQGAGTLTIVPAPPAATCATTTFVSNNGGAVGGTVYFNVTFSQNVVIARLATNSAAIAGTPISADIFVNPAGWVGNAGTMTGWTYLTTATGVSAGPDLPSGLTLNVPLYGAGTLGVAIRAVGFAHRYTNGTVANMTAMSPDGVISLSLGGASNVPFVAPTFSPRVWNGTLCHEMPIGTSYCDPQPANSTGNDGRLSINGNDCAAGNLIVLTARDLPLNAFGYFLTSTTATSGTPAGMGFLCLGGAVGRGVGGQVFPTGPFGRMQTITSLTLPHPVSGTVQVMAGDTYNFQGWTRDLVGGAPTSNTTNAVSVLFN